MGEFHKRLKEMMDNRGMKQKDLVEKTGIEKSLISSYLSGRYIPKDDKVQLIAKALNCDPLWLIGYDGINEDEEQSFVELFRLLTADEKRTIGKILQYLTDPSRRFNG